MVGRKNVASVHPTRGLSCCRQRGSTLGAERDGKKFPCDPEESSWLWLLPTAPEVTVFPRLC